MIEATIGTVLLLFAALIAIQFVLVFHGALAGHSAVVRAARTYAITQDHGKAEDTMHLQMTTAIQGIEWSQLSCGNVSYSGGGMTQAARCEVEISIPAVIPGAGAAVGGSLTGPIPLLQSGLYPFGSRSGI